MIFLQTEHKIQSPEVPDDSKIDMVVHIHMSASRNSLQYT